MRVPNPENIEMLKRVHGKCPSLLQQTYFICCDSVPLRALHIRVYRFSTSSDLFKSKFNKRTFSFVIFSANMKLAYIAVAVALFEVLTNYLRDTISFHHLVFSSTS